VIRFQQCLTRSVTLIKMYWLNFLRTLYADITSKTTGKVSRDLISNRSFLSIAFKELRRDILETLLVNKFEHYSLSLQPLLEQLEKRSQTDPQEYESLLKECFQSWFAVRQQLLEMPITSTIRELENPTSGLVEMVSRASGM
jgi:conserved oligomeric Golgi complex subunit 3